MLQSEFQENWGASIPTTKSRSSRRNYASRLSMLHIVLLTILLAIMTSATILGFERLWQSFLNSSVFILKGITIEGNHRVSSADILEAANLNVGSDRVYSIMPHIVEKRIKEHLPYLEQVKVWRGMVRKEGEELQKIRGWVNIEVTVRQPIAFINSQGNYIVIDYKGVILEEESDNSISHRPLIIGIDETSLRETQNLRRGVTRGDLEPEALNLALDVLTNILSLTPELFGEISYVDARDQDNILLVLDTQSPANSDSNKITVRLASDRIEEGINCILPVIVKRREESKRTDYIDARFSGALYCAGD